MKKETDTQFAMLLNQSIEVLTRAADALNVAISGMPAPNGFQALYLRQQALSVASVALDVELLVTHRRNENVIGLCRIAFEARINLCAAIKLPEFAVQKYMAGAKGHVEELEELVKTGRNSDVFVEELKHHQQLLKDLRQDCPGMKEKAWWKFDEVAKAAGMMADYEAHYSTLSKATHGTWTGLLVKADNSVLAASVLRLLFDTIETCAALVFFPSQEGTPKPTTARWKELVDPLAAFQSEYGDLAKQLNQLLNETFRPTES